MILVIQAVTRAIDQNLSGNEDVFDVADDMVQVSYLDETTQQDVYAFLAAGTYAISEMTNPDDASDVWGDHIVSVTVEMDLALITSIVDARHRTWRSDYRG